jgi:pyruvate/2-oxoglutarate dehydrogenase complex dihydrolipoamide dehydrogenase (E3) component
VVSHNWISSDACGTTRARADEEAGVTIHTDVVVLGLGPGGEDAAGRLCDAGLDVVGVEAELVGGECPYWGCVPSKMIIRAANLLEEARRAGSMAGAADVRADWALVARRIRDEATDSWDDAVAAKRFEDKGGRLLRGWGRLDGPGRVVVGDEVVVAARGVIIAMGARAVVPPISGLAGTPYWTNREAIEATELPASLLVLGGGAIGVELAQAFRRFGAAVTVLEAGSRIVGPEEPEASEVLTSVLRAEGIEVRTSASADAVSYADGKFTVSVAGGAPSSAAALLVAVGRRPDLASLGVASIGLDEHAAAVPTDDHLRVPGAQRTWALGDVTGHGAFTHMSMYEADIVVNDVLGRDVVPADYRAVPRVTFTDPEIGSVGVTEAAARDQGIAVRTGVASIPGSARGWIHKAGNEGLIKVVEDADRGVLVGATSMGPSGGEVLGFLALAVAAGVPTGTLRHLPYAYPTFHRAIETAIKDLGP